MGTKFIPPIKVLFYGDVNVAQEHIKFARNQLAILERQMSFQNLNEGRRVVSPYNGIVVECLSSFSRHEVRIYVNESVSYAKPPVMINQEKVIKKEFDQIISEIRSLAYNWTWDAELVPDPPSNTPEEYATRVIDANCFVGFVGDKGLILQEPVTIPAITDHLTPYRVTDLSQVRYKATTGKVSLVLSDYCEQADNAIRYTAISVLGEGGFPSIVFDVSLNIDDYSTETTLLGTVDCVVEVDAALSNDLQTLYKIVVVKGSAADAKNAVINYEVYILAGDPLVWTYSKGDTVHAPGSSFATPLLFINKKIRVDRDGQMGVFSYENLAPTTVYELNTSERTKSTYKSFSQKYTYSLDSDTFTETDTTAYLTKIVNIDTYDYEIVKSDDSISTEDITRTFHGAPRYYLHTIDGYYTTGASLSITGFSESGLFFSESHSHIDYDVIDMQESNTGNKDFYTLSGGIVQILPRRTVLIYPVHQYLHEISSAAAYFQRTGSGIYPDCAELLDEHGQMDPSISGDPLNVAQAMIIGCPPYSYPFELIGTGTFYDYVYGHYEMTVSEFALRRYQGINPIYPNISLVKGVVELKNAFICCDNALKAAFYGQHVRSTLDTQPLGIVQVPLYNDPDYDESSYSEWYVMYKSQNTGVLNVTGSIRAKYGDALLTDLTDPSILSVAPIDNWPPWKKTPPEYTSLESFFGVIFYGGVKKMLIE